MFPETTLNPRSFGLCPRNVFIRVVDLNAHLFDDAAMAGSIPLPLYNDDERRAKTIGTNLGFLDADIFGGQEVWTSRAVQSLLAGANSLGERFPYSLTSSFHPGFNKVLDHHADTDRTIAAFRALRNAVDKYPRFTPAAKSLFQALILVATQIDLIVREGLDVYNPFGDRLESWFDKFVKNQLILGGGLVLFSRYPIILEHSGFEPFRYKSGVEQGAEKGILYGRIEFPFGREVTAVVSHLQEGNSDDSKEVRERQIYQLSDVIKRTPGPHILMIDANINGEMEVGKKLKINPEYEKMIEILEVQDAFAQGQWTYDGQTEFAKKLRRNRIHPRFQRIDYILYRGGLMLNSNVTDVLNVFEGQTDHKGLKATFTF